MKTVESLQWMVLECPHCGRHTFDRLKGLELCIFHVISMLL